MDERGTDIGFCEGDGDDGSVCEAGGDLMQLGSSESVSGIELGDARFCERLNRAELVRLVAAGEAARRVLVGEGFGAQVSFDDEGRVIGVVDEPLLRALSVRFELGKVVR